MRLHNIAFLALLSAFSLTLNAAAQDTETVAAEPRDHFVTLSVEPVWLIIGGLGAKADFRITDKISLGIDGMYVPPRSFSGTDSANSLNEDYKWSTYEVYVGPTFMLTGDFNHRGVYLTSAIGYTSTKVTDFGTSGLSGQLSSAELRLSVGYQFVVRNFKFVTGGGFRLLNTSDVVVKDSSGNEVFHDKSDAFGGLALDLQAGYMF